MARAVYILLGALAIYAVWNTAAVRIRLTQAEIYRKELSEQIAELTAENQWLEREIAQSEGAAAVERAAREKLGLVRPGELIFRVITPETRERE